MQKQAAEDADVSAENIIARIFASSGAKINPKDTPENPEYVKESSDNASATTRPFRQKNIICVPTSLSYLIILPAVLKMRILCEKDGSTLPGIPLWYTSLWH